MKLASMLTPLLIASLAAACSSEDSETLPEQYQFGGDRPVDLDVPTSYDHDTPTPLLIMLHGYSANAFVQTAYTGLGNLVDEQGVLFLAPDGTVDESGNQFWNANSVCCDFFDTGVDDVAYIGGLIDDVSAVWNVDPARVFLFGHSNGGYMSYRMACERSEAIAGIVSLAGAAGIGADACDPSDPVSVLQIHGTQDESVPYDVSTDCMGVECDHPGALGSAEVWAGYNGCGDMFSEQATRLDIDDAVAGEETRVDRFDGCPAGVDAELWTIEAGTHIPNLRGEFATLVWEWMNAHPAP